MTDLNPDLTADLILDAALPMAFAQLQLAEPLARAVADMGYESITPTQAQAIPVVMTCQDVMGASQTGTDTICPFCGVGCTLSLTVQDGAIVKAGSPHDHSVTHGNLCIKGRFGWAHVQPPSRRAQ